MTLGIVASNISPQGMIKVVTDWILLPPIADVNYFSSASDGSTQGNFDISAAVNGTPIFLSRGGKRPLRIARLPTLTVTDASGSTLTCTVRIKGRRFGFPVTQDLVMTTSGTTITGTRVIDEMTSATIISITNNTTSDVLTIGTDGTRYGLTYPIKSIKSVKLVEKILAGVPDTGDSITTAGVRAGSTLQNSTVVFPIDSSVNMTVPGMYTSGSEAATDQYFVKYVVDGVDEFIAQGRTYG